MWIYLGVRGVGRWAWFHPSEQGFEPDFCFRAANNKTTNAYMQHWLYFYTRSCMMRRKQFHQPAQSRASRTRVLVESIARVV